MTYRSASRGILYTAPPSGDENDETTERAESADDAETERERPSLGTTTSTTDANWTGTVSTDGTAPADD